MHMYLVIIIVRYYCDFSVNIKMKVEVMAYVTILQLIKITVKRHAFTSILETQYNFYDSQVMASNYYKYNFDL